MRLELFLFTAFAHDRRGEVKDRRVIPFRAIPSGAPMRRISVPYGRRSGDKLAPWDKLAPERRGETKDRRYSAGRRRIGKAMHYTAERRGSERGVGRRVELPGRRSTDDTWEYNKKDRRLASGPRRLHPAATRRHDSFGRRKGDRS